MIDRTILPLQADATQRALWIEQRPSGAVTLKKQSRTLTAPQKSLKQTNSPTRKVVPSCCNTTNSAPNIHTSVSTPPSNKSAAVGLKPGYGLPCKPSQFSGRSSSKVREYVSTLLINYPNACRFVVLTLPKQTDQSKNALENYSGYIINKLSSSLRKRYPESHFLWVWEYQVGGALHLNLVIGFPTDVPDLLNEKLLSLWLRLLVGVMNKVGIDIFAPYTAATFQNHHCCRVFDCDKNLPGYLAKAEQKIPRIRRDGLAVSPARWFGASKNLQRLLDRSIVRVAILCDSESEQERAIRDLTAQISCNVAPKPIKNPFRDNEVGVRLVSANLIESAAIIENYAASVRLANRPDGKTILEEIASLLEIPTPQSQTDLRLLPACLFEKQVWPFLSEDARCYLQNLDIQIKTGKGLQFPLDYMPALETPVIKAKASSQVERSSKKGKKTNPSPAKRSAQTQQPKDQRCPLSELNEKRQNEAAEHIRDAFVWHKVMYNCEPSQTKLASFSRSDKRTVKKFLKSLSGEQRVEIEKEVRFHRRGGEAEGSGIGIFF